MKNRILLFASLLAGILACECSLVTAEDGCAPAGDLKFVCGPSGKGGITTQKGAKTENSCRFLRPRM